MTDFVLNSAAQSIAANGSWSTQNNTLFFKGEPVTLHGFSTSCTPYLIQKLSNNDGKTACWATYNHDDPENIITELAEDQASAAIGYLNQAKAPGVLPTFRVPLCATSWLGEETASSKAAMAKYPNLAVQYQTLIQNLVKRFTDEEIVVILDLHWNNDDDAQTEMALR